MQEARYDTSARPASLATVAAKMGSAATAPQQAAPAHYSLRSGPRILRLWVKPWEDADGDLNGESVVYIQVEGGRWLVDHAQRQVRDAYAPVRVLGQRSTSAAGAAVPSDVSTATKSPERPAPTVRQLSQALPEAASKALKSAQDQAVPDEAN
jgi:conjugal transfer pilus assembly protein TraV